MAGSITVDVKALNKLAKELKGFDKEIAGAAYQAVNRTLDHVRTVTARAVSKKYNIKQADIKPPKSGGQQKPACFIFVKTPSKSDTNASIEFRGRVLSAMHFQFKPNQAMKLPKRNSRETPVKVKIKKSGGYKRVSSTPNKPFVLKFQSNKNLNIWYRKGKKLYPVEVLRTLSVPQMVSNPQIESIISQEAEKTLSDRVNHEINYRLSKIKKKINP